MTDKLVERLRRKCPGTNESDADTMAEAADEIERLTALLSQAREAALEEAAKVAEEYRYFGFDEWIVFAAHTARDTIAKAIRSISGKER